MDLEFNVKSFPARPGVYIFKDDAGTIIYIGKAKSLRARVRQYFGPHRDERPQIQFLMRRVRDIDYVVTDTEKEALLLENTLIKKHQPRYNISLKDDKTYLSIRIGMEHTVPGISVTRRSRKDGARYFGPYLSGLGCRQVIDEITCHFKIRSCSDHEFANRVRPCLLYDIGRCTAPCVGRIDGAAYAKQIEEAILFLEGRRRRLTSIFRARMKEASAAHRYEEAARYRDLLAGIDEMVEKQRVVRHGAGDRDVVAMVVEDMHATACILTINKGALTDKRIRHLGRVTDDASAAFESFLMQWYGGAHEIPSEIIVSHRIEGQAPLAEILSERRHAPMRLKMPRRGPAAGLIRLALDNAREAMRHKKDAHGHAQDVLDRLSVKLGLPTVPDVIECLDISNLQGKDAYGSLVTFTAGEPDKARYRLYRIQHIERPDDYAMMREVLERRFGPPPIDKLGRSDARHEFPDLLLIDGGKGQLGIAKRALDEIGAAGLPLAAIAKGVSKGRESDDVYIPGRANPISFRRKAPELALLMRIRDEAHRFGITAHRKRRLKNLVPQR